MEQIQDIKAYLTEQPLIFDGAMGTYLNGQYEECKGNAIEEWNLIRPECIKQVHRSYIEAGAVAIKTNTFGVRMGVAGESDAHKKEQIRAAVSVARQAMEESDGIQFLFGDIGPNPLDDKEEMNRSYEKIVDCFLEYNVSNFLFETLDHAEGLEHITSYIKERNENAFIIVSFGVSPEGFTRSGYYGRSLYEKALAMPKVDAVGFNCISGPKHLAELLHKVDIPGAGKYISVMPNAGYPAVFQNRTFYGAEKTYYAKALHEMGQQGAAILGGCCGTTPEYLQEFTSLLQEHPLAGVTLTSQPEQDTDAVSVGEDALAPMENTKNSFAAKLRRGEKVLVVELDPPVEPDIAFFMEGAAKYQKAGVDAIDIADCPVAKARIDSSILACKVMRELGLTAIPHMTCRDRNINATKALLLGLNIEGVNNVLTVTGDPVPMAERDQVKTMFSYNSAVLANHIRTLNTQIFSENPFMVSGALNINAKNFESQITHAKRKIENGVSVLFTQPVLSEQALDNLKHAREELSVKILGGIMPVVSYRNACFMNNEMAGIHVDEKIVEAYKDKDREQGEALALEISTKVAKAINPYVDGFYLITPFKRVELILRIIEQIRSL